MNTKTSILTALVALASGAAAVAQPVYSQNVVGYVNLNMVANGFTLVANQLSKGGNTLNEVLPGVPLAAEVSTWTGSAYASAIYDGSSWIDPQTGDPSPLTVPPGKGFFFFNPEANPVTVTLTGEVTLGASSVALKANGFSLISTVVPQQIELSAANGFPQVLAMEYLTFANNSYTSSINDGTGWINSQTGDPVTVSPAIGQGFFIFNPEGATSWNRTFSL